VQQIFITSAIPYDVRTNLKEDHPRNIPKRKIFWRLAYFCSFLRKLCLVWANPIFVFLQIGTEQNFKKMKIEADVKFQKSDQNVWMQTVYQCYARQCIRFYHI